MKRDASPHGLPVSPGTRSRRGAAGRGDPADQGPAPRSMASTCQWPPTRCSPVFARVLADKTDALIWPVLASGAYPLSSPMPEASVSLFNRANRKWSPRSPVSLLGIRRQPAVIILNTGLSTIAPVEATTIVREPCRIPPSTDASLRAALRKPPAESKRKRPMFAPCR